MSQFNLTFKRILKQPGFMAAFIILLVAALGLNATAKFMKLHFKKIAVPLAQPLDDIPQVLGTWYCVSKDQLSDEMEQELQTQFYVMRYYIDSTVVTMEDIEKFKGKSPAEAVAITNDLRLRYKESLDRAMISFAVTYHTGKADTVAHIPERCYTADGFQPTAIEQEIWDLPKTGRYPDYDNKVRYISFEDQSGATSVKRNVSYFFNVNGRYESDPTRVRISLQNLFQRYGYYSKIELMIQDRDREKSGKVMQDFLKHAMPAVEACYPKWSDYESKSK